MKIDQEFKSLIPLLQLDEYNLLEESIKNEGCRDPLLVWQDVLIDGHNRYDICMANKISFGTKELRFKDKNEVKIWIIKNQFGRRNLSNYDRSLLALQLEDLFKSKAKENLSLAGQGLQISAKVNTREELAQTANVSHDTISRVQTIEQKATPEVKEKLRKQKISINKAYSDIIREEKRNEIRNCKVQIELPNGEFNVIYCDPPWKYEFVETESRAIENQYPTMVLDEIKQIKVPSADNAVLLMWATAPKLEEALEVIKSWGFVYRTCAVWDKEKIGMGYWFRGQHELLLVAVKGKQPAPLPENRFSSVIREKRLGHSKKPIIVYEMIEKMFPNSKYLELFSRNKRDNWTIWGNENL